MRMNMNTVLPLAVTGVLATGALAGCGEPNDDPRIKFNALVGGSEKIQVYPGPTDSDADRRNDGSYYRDGAVAAVTCYVMGREVKSDVTVGEADRISSK